MSVKTNFQVGLVSSGKAFIISGDEHTNMVLLKARLRKIGYTNVFSISNAEKEQLAKVEKLQVYTYNSLATNFLENTNLEPMAKVS